MRERDYGIVGERMLRAVYLLALAENSQKGANPVFPHVTDFGQLNIRLHVTFGGNQR